MELSRLKSQTVMNLLFFVFVCLLVFLFRNDITHHKNHFMSLQALAQAGNSEAPLSETLILLIMFKQYNM